MSDPLVRAFEENREPGQGCASPEEIWRAVAGLEDAERSVALVKHTIRCGDCAQLWRLARQAQADSQPGSAPPPTTEVTPLRRLRSWRGGVVAGAGLALAASLLVFLRQPPAEDTERGSPRRAIASRTASELPREEFVLRWAPQGEGARYRIQVTLLDLTELDSATELLTPEHLVPASVLVGIPSGSDVLWRVEARLPDGRTVTSSPFRTRVR
jgi:hypothetical protein